MYDIYIEGKDGLVGITKADTHRLVGYEGVVYVDMDRLTQDTFVHILVSYATDASDVLDVYRPIGLYLETGAEPEEVHKHVVLDKYSVQVDGKTKYIRIDEYDLITEEEMWKKYPELLV